MKITRVCIENFRCLHQVDIALEDITSFLGPTGAGKSTVLRALDWFFNGEKEVGLSAEDLHSSGSGSRIRVEVEFGGLTEADREVLGPHYAPLGADRLIVWRTWEGGEDKITAKGLAFPPFEEVRAGNGAMARRRAYRELREARPELGLPVAGTGGEVENAMRTWEVAHRDQLTETDIAGTHFFGFAGQGVLAKLVDFVFVSADLRAPEETHDSRASALGRLMDHAVNRAEATKRITEIEDNAAAERERVHHEAYGEVLAGLSAELSREVGLLTAGRQVQVMPMVQVPKPAKTQFRVTVQDGAADTSVDRQGHGFQRALILVALKYLAEHRLPGESARTLCLAIEEPELFQHPAQARTFAEVLRTLAGNSDRRAQVMYATHSPSFIDQRSYHEVRRLERGFADRHPMTAVGQVTQERLTETLEPYGVTADMVRWRAGIHSVESLAEAFFADVAVLVEGPTDRSIVQACAERQGINLGARGIVCVSAGGKDNLMLSHAILSALNVRCHVLFDGDVGKIDSGSSDAGRLAQVNSNLLGYLGAPRKTRPEDESQPTHTVLAENLDAYLKGHWPAWESRRCELVATRAWKDGKHAATYAEAARTAATAPPDLLHALLENVRMLARC